MSRQDVDMAVALRDLLFELGDEIDHIPVSGETEPITAIVNEHLPSPSTDAVQGDRQVFTAQLTMSQTYDSGITVGRGSEVSKFSFNGHVWRAVAKAKPPGVLVVQVERNVTKTIKKGFGQGVP